MPIGLIGARVTARTTFEPVDIVVKGVFRERIELDRDEVTLRGADATAGLDGGTVQGLKRWESTEEGGEVAL